MVAMLMGDLVLLNAYLKRMNWDGQSDKDVHQDVRQRKLYLLQAMGAKLRYTFGWGLYGPYSPDLAADLYEADQFGRAAENGCRSSEARAKEFEERAVSEQTQNLIDQAKVLMTPPKWAATLSASEWIELISSLRFLVEHHRGLDQDREAEVIEDLLVRRPHFADLTLVRKAYCYLHDFLDGVKQRTDTAALSW
jgi:hypothetical protein